MVCKYRMWNINSQWVIFSHYFPAVNHHALLERRRLGSTPKSSCFNIFTMVKLHGNFSFCSFVSALKSPTYTFVSFQRPLSLRVREKICDVIAHNSRIALFLGLFVRAATEYDLFCIKFSCTLGINFLCWLSALKPFFRICSEHGSAFCIPLRAK